MKEQSSHCKAPRNEKLGYKGVVVKLHTCLTSAGWRMVSFTTQMHTENPYSSDVKLGGAYSRYDPTAKKEA